MPRKQKVKENLYLTLDPSWGYRLWKGTIPPTYTKEFEEFEIDYPTMGDDDTLDCLKNFCRDDWNQITGIKLRLRQCVQVNWIKVSISPLKKTKRKK